MPGTLCRRAQECGEQVSLSSSSCSASARNAIDTVASLQVQPVCDVLSTKDFLNLMDSASLATLYK